MKGWIKSFKEKIKKHFSDYGKIFIFSLLIVFLFAVLYILFLVVAPSKLIVSFLDVGQGDAIFIRTPSKKQILIDGGPTNKILERLTSEMSYFDKHIDVILATHPDADHVTGLIPVMNYFKVDTVLLSPSDGKTALYGEVIDHARNEGEVRVAHTGDVIDFHDGVIIKILYPNKNYISTSDTNDASVSLELIYGDETFLLTGDLPSKRETDLIGNGLTKNITVYKAGHHGSNTSSSEALLSYIKPEYSIISAGKDNKYGHPNIETIERLKKYSKEIISTIDRGTITFTLDGKGLRFETDK